MLREFATVEECLHYWKCGETSLNAAAQSHHGQPRRPLEQDLEMQKQIIDTADYVDFDNKDSEYRGTGEDLRRVHKNLKDKIKRGGVKVSPTTDH